MNCNVMKCVPSLFCVGWKYKMWLKLINGFMIMNTMA